MVPRRVERHLPQFPDHDAGPRQPDERDEAHDPALPAQDVRVGVAAWSKNDIIISSWPNSRMTTKLPAVLGGQPCTGL
jgi:hypothetical protein